MSNLVLVLWKQQNGQGLYCQFLIAVSKELGEGELLSCFFATEDPPFCGIFTQVEVDDRDWSLSFGPHPLPGKPRSLVRSSHSKDHETIMNRVMHANQMAFGL